MAGFVLTLVLTVVIAVGTFFPGTGIVPGFATSWWFKALGIVVFIASFAIAVKSAVQTKWTSAVCHFGVVLLLVGVARDVKSVTVQADLKVGETITTYNMLGTEQPLGFELTLLDFREPDYVSRVQLDGRETRTIAPSRPAFWKGWLILQDRFDRTSDTNRFMLRAGTGETLRVKTGDRFRVPGREMELVFDGDFAMARDTMFRFRVFEQDREKLTAFISRRATIPATLDLGLTLLDFQLGGRYVSILQIVRRPGAGTAFAGFIVILVGLLMLTIGTLRRPVIDDSRKGRR